MGARWVDGSPAVMPRLAFLAAALDRALKQVEEEERGDGYKFDGGIITCDCRCHLPIGSDFTAGRETCIHCRLIA